MEMGVPDLRRDEKHRSKENKRLPCLGCKRDEKALQKATIGYMFPDIISDSICCFECYTCKVCGALQAGSPGRMPFHYDPDIETKICENCLQCNECGKGFDFFTKIKVEHRVDGNQYYHQMLYPVNNRCYERHITRQNIHTFLLVWQRKGRTAWFPKDLLPMLFQYVKQLCLYRCTRCLSTIGSRIRCKCPKCHTTACSCVRRHNQIWLSDPFISIPKPSVTRDECEKIWMCDSCYYNETSSHAAIMYRICIDEFNQLQKYNIPVEMMFCKDYEDLAKLRQRIAFEKTKAQLLTKPKKKRKEKVVKKKQPKIPKGFKQKHTKQRQHRMRRY